MRTYKAHSRSYPEHIYARHPEKRKYTAQRHCNAQNYQYNRKRIFRPENAFARTRYAVLFHSFFLRFRKTDIVIIKPLSAGLFRRRYRFCVILAVFNTLVKTFKVGVAFTAELRLHFIPGGFSVLVILDVFGKPFFEFCYSLFFFVVGVLFRPAVTGVFIGNISVFILEVGQKFVLGLDFLSFEKSVPPKLERKHFANKRIYYRCKVARGIAVRQLVIGVFGNIEKLFVVGAHYKLGSALCAVITEKAFPPYFARIHRRAEFFHTLFQVALGFP